MFTTPCFIRKNTLELRKKLETLGYKNRHLSMITNVEEYPLLQVYRDGFYDGIIGDECGLEFYIDCGTNEELFFALAALRDDSDYMQWFVSPKTHTKRLSGCFGQIVGMDGHYQEIVCYTWHRYENKNNALTQRLNEMILMEVEDIEFLPHKATVEEIIEYFKDK